jgi:hypothetical protein
VIWAWLGIIHMLHGKHGHKWVYTPPYFYIDWLNKIDGGYYGTY